MKTEAFFIFLFFLLVSSCFSSLALAKPHWLKEGLTVTYRLSVYEIWTRIIEVLPPHGVAIEGMSYCNGTYSWRVRSLNGSYAEVEVELDLVYRDRDYEKKVDVIRPWNKTTSVRINVDNRDTMALNGTNLGKINYWIDPNVEKRSSVVVYGKPPYAINATVYDYGYNPLKTPAGEFDCWLLQVGGTRPDVGTSARLDLWYDKATGILVAAHMSYYDVVLMLMGIPAIQVIEDTFQAPSCFVLESLTTSFPSEEEGESGQMSPQFLNLSDYIPYIVAAIAVAAIPTAIYITRRKRRKTQAAE